MIVRTEAAVIEQCLRSVVNFIDYWVILDTGSEDNTPHLIESFFLNAGVQGELHHGQFENFGETRNQALELCRASTSEFDFILFIDADMELVVEDHSCFQSLSSQAYTLQQRNDLAYDNVRIIQRDSTIQYIGVTHEYLDATTEIKPLVGAHMLDHACGSNRVNKSGRDVELLTQALKKEPNNPRYQFYLAQSLRDDSRFEEALVAYRKRADMGGYEEEAWYALYQAANCLLLLGEEESFISEALNCWNQRPGRAEPLLLISRHYRQQEKYNLACEFAAIGLRTPLPEQDRLFVETAVYQWAFLQELSIAGHYADNPLYRHLGRSSCHRLAQSSTIPEEVRKQARLNLTFYAHDARNWLGLRTREIRVEPDTGQPFCFNPSVSLEPEGRGVLVRQSNYQLLGGRYVIDDSDGVIRTQNFLVLLDGQLLSLTQHAVSNMNTAVEFESRSDFPVHGYEDCRLFYWRKSWWVSCTVRDTREDGLCEIALLKLSDDGVIQSETIMRGGWSEQHQKNWMPLVVGDELMFVYSLSPTKILHFNPEKQLVEQLHESIPNAALEHLRGGSQLVRTRRGWLGVCHEVCFHSDGQRNYLHRFFLLNTDFQLQAISEVFTFTGAAIEFCAGLALEADGSTLVISFGVNDGQALLGTVELERVFAVLNETNSVS